MDAAALITSLAGGATSFGAAWLTIARKLRKLELPSVEGKDEKARARVAAIDAEAQRLRESIDELREQLRRMDERLQHAVSDEELSAYVQQTTQTLIGLTEKVGHVTGVLEASRNR
jgi:chromosome segregation ATPase